MTVTSLSLKELLEKLAGEHAPLNSTIPQAAEDLLTPSGAGLGCSQLNELLILLGFDRVTRSFFQYLVDGTTEHSLQSTISSFSSLETGVDRFRQTALLLFGNVKFAYKRLSRDSDALCRCVERLRTTPIERFHTRHESVRPIDEIDGNETYYLGYLVERDLKRRLADYPHDEAAQREWKVREKIVEKGLANHEAYLVSDHLDVYVATSMRERHEFATVSSLVREIFGRPELCELKLRHFDPTQAYCKDRIDKGLAEALMLRRAQCTIYFAQESDTLGKDSELASTLAQGKPVIAFVPSVDDQYAEKLLTALKNTYSDLSERQLLLRQLRLFEPDAAWNDEIVRQWIENPASIDVSAAKNRLQKKIFEHYDKRANTLKDSHPLGVQINLATGVANGVLVVRTVDQCAELVRRIVTRALEFTLDEKEGYTLLREKISGCVFRAMTNDEMLTNSFWNFYSEPSE